MSRMHISGTTVVPVPERRTTTWIDNVQWWTGEDVNMVRTNAMERMYDC